MVKRLPEAVEDWPWGSIHCKVAGKIFVGWSRDASGAMSIGVRTTLPLQSMLVGSDPRVTIAKYVGKHGGIDIRLAPKPDWHEVEQFIVESYRIIAPKRLVKLLDAGPTVAPAKKPAARPAAPAKKPAAKKPSAKAKASGAKKPAAKKPAKAKKSA